MAELRHGGLDCVEAADLAPAFVLGSLEPVQAAAVRAHLAACSTPHREFEELGSVVPALLESVPIVEPPESLRARLLGAAAATAPDAVRAPRVVAEEASGPTEAMVPPIVSIGPIGAIGRIDPTDRAVVRRDPNRLRRASTLLGMAAVLAIVVLGAWNVMLQGQLGAAGRYADALAAALELAARPGSAVAVLAPATTGGPAGLAAIGSDGSLAIAVRGLAPTTGREVYEAWTISGSGAPVPVGAFTVGADGTGVLAARSQPGSPNVVVALTREPGPGATTPTLPIVASGSTAPRPG